MMNSKILIILFYITNGNQSVSTGKVEIRDLPESKCNQIKVALVNDLKRPKERGVTTIISANCY